MKSIFDFEGLSAYLVDNGHKPYRLGQVYDAVFRAGARTIEEMHTLPADLRAGIAGCFALPLSRLVLRQDSGDGTTTKLLIELSDGKKVEAVVMRHIGKEGKPRNTLCVSSQVGCAMGCSFCATGAMGLMRDMRADEIVEQLWHAGLVDNINNVVMMGMGEPLANYDNTVSAICMMNDQKKWGIGARHITVSTSGLPVEILRLAVDLPQVNLAVSLHAPNQVLRESIMPIARAHNLDDLMLVLDKYFRATRRRIFYEYVMLRGVNDHDMEARQLGRLLQGRSAHLNLIPYNSTDTKFGFCSTDFAKIKHFQKIVSEYGVPSTVRQEMGGDIDGACGQLAGL